MNTIDPVSDKDIETSLWYIRNKSKIKRIIIFVLIFTIAALFIFSIFYFVKILVNDSNDKNKDFATIDWELVKKNNKAMDIEFVSKDYISLGGGKYNFVAIVYNPNKEHVVYDIAYKFTYNGIDGKELHAFIRPEETKVLMDFNVGVSENIDLYDFQIVSISYKKTKQIDMKNLSYDNFSIENQVNNLINSENTNRNWVEFDAKNISPYNFKKVAFNVILYLGEKIIAIDRIEEKNFYSNESRHIEASWFYKIPSYVSVVIVPEINIFDKTNYIQNK